MIHRLIVAALLSLPTAVAAGKQAPPQPPAENPHPPSSPEDIASVAFANEAVQAFLTKELTLPASAAAAATAYASKDAPCLKDTACWQKDGAFVSDVQRIYSVHGTINETKHAHVVPASTPRKLDQKKAATRDEPPPDMIPLKDDEHAVHIYVRTTKSSGWADLSIILVREASGKLSLRRFILESMRSQHKLPPGAKC